jgi:hypothetical protein
VADNSEKFYQDSKKALTESVEQMNKGNEVRFFYAGLPETTEEDGTVTVNPRYAFGAPDRHQWLIPIRIFFFWAIFKDNTYWHRQPLCRKFISNPVDTLVCDSNPAFHPNVAGAVEYAKSIKGVIPPTVIQNWRESVAEAQTH